MKKTFAFLLCLIILLSVSTSMIFAEEEKSLEFRPEPEIIKLDDIENSELFEIVDEFEGRVSEFNYSSGARYVSSRNISLFPGFYDGRQAGSVMVEGFEVPAFTDISGKAIAFENSRNSAMDMNQIVAKTSATSPFLFRRHQYSNGYFFITQTVFIPESYINNRTAYYSFCYDTVNNILYQLPGEISEVNEYGEGFFYAIKTTYTMNGLNSEVTDIYKVKLKKYPIVSVFYNGEKVLFDQLPVIENGRTLVPLRAIFEKIGAEVSWDAETSTITAVKDSTEIKLTLNSTTAYKNGEAITLDVPAKSVNGRTLVPVRFIADCFGVDVKWNPDYQRVTLTAK